MRQLRGTICLAGVCFGIVAPAAVGSESADPFQRERERMVDRQLRARDINDVAVLEAMREVPRHELVPARLRDFAYEDRPLPIGYEQTISQPYIVALMTQLARVKEGDRVLEVGTGSGYQAAVLAAMGAEVYTIEIVEELAVRAEQDLGRLGYESVHVRAGDGYAGWPEHAPFDAIIVTAAPARIPQPLLDQMAVGGRLVIPVGPVGRVQELRLVTRTAAGHRTEPIIPVRFVPMTGRSQAPE